MNKTIHRTNFPTLLLFLSLNAWANTHSFLAYSVLVVPCKEIRIPESCALESGPVQLKESGIPLTIGIQVLLTNTGIRYLESGIHSVESKTVLDSPTWIDFSNCLDFNWGMLDFQHECDQGAKNWTVLLLWLGVDVFTFYLDTYFVAIYSVFINPFHFSRKSIWRIHL